MSKESVFIIGITSQIDSIEPAILRPGRIDVHIRINMPNYKSREQIFANVLKCMPNSLSDEKIKELAIRTDGYSSSSLVDICREAAMVCIRKGLNQIDQDHFIF